MIRRGLRTWWLLAVAAWATSCADPDDDGPCEMISEWVCADCFDRVVTCRFEGVEYTESSCQDCQAQRGLLELLCAQGSTATRADIYAAMVCDDDL